MAPRHVVARITKIMVLPCPHVTLFLETILTDEGVHFQHCKNMKLSWLVGPED